MKSRIIFVQEQLKQKGLYFDTVDGLIGDNTLNALNKIDGINKNWSSKRKIIGFIQLICLEKGINPGDVDGYWGPNTENGYDRLIHLLEKNKLPDPWRPEDLPNVNPNNWPKQYTPEFDEFYGERGTGLKRLHLPYPHRISWNTNQVINSYYCHEKVHDSMLRILEKVLDHYGIDEIKKLRLDLWGGCYNERQIRGGTKWSMHSWGIAVDYDPVQNKLKWGRDKATFAHPEYDKWWEFWEEEGWVSLGRQRNFDWMHVQAAKL